MILKTFALKNFSIQVTFGRNNKMIPNDGPFGHRMTVTFRYSQKHKEFYSKTITYIESYCDEITLFKKSSM